MVVLIGLYRAKYQIFLLHHLYPALYKNITSLSSVEGLNSWTEFVVQTDHLDSHSSFDQSYPYLTHFHLHSNGGRVSAPVHH